MNNYELEGRNGEGKEAEKEQDDLNISGNHYSQERLASKGSEEQCQGKRASGTPG